MRLKIQEIKFGQMFPRMRGISVLAHYGLSINTPHARQGCHFKQLSERSVCKLRLILEMQMDVCFSMQPGKLIELI